MADIVTKRVADILLKSSSFAALPFEVNFNPLVMTTFAKDNWPLVIGIVVGYLIFITVGSRIMQNSKAYNLRLQLAGWNAFLCIFSFIGMCKTVSLFL